MLEPQALEGRYRTAGRPFLALAAGVSLRYAGMRSVVHMITYERARP